MNNSNNKKANTEKVRINKFFTDCGVLSRRAAEAEIEAIMDMVLTYEGPVAAFMKKLA